MAHYSYKRVRDQLIEAGWLTCNPKDGIVPVDKEKYGERLDVTYLGNLYEMAADYIESLKAKQR